jgi:hypothetical protein
MQTNTTIGLDIATAGFDCPEDRGTGQAGRRCGLGQRVCHRVALHVIDTGAACCARVVSGSLTMAPALRCACRLEQGAMLRVSAVAVEGEREQDLISSDAR